MSVETTRSTMTRYFDSAHTDMSTMADDVVFTVMGTGEEHKGPTSILQMLEYFYKVAFDANSETRFTLFGESSALIEANFVGKHVGEFAGVPATNKQVNVPLCVVYELVDGKIKTGRIYFEMPILLKQLGVA